MCFQCHMPYQCSTGFCYGDYCVKSLVGDKYVSKGCENRNTPRRGSDMSARALPSADESTSLDLGCFESEVFGVPNTICICNDSDFCNSVSHKGPSTFLIAMCVLSVFAFVLR
ncbi:Protein T01B7.9 [Aphelenchoides avenae]|nr:Protein T01B7.9 [Aphelenchus avenae]